MMKIKSYLLNCFLLLIPIFLWNILLYDYLPDLYQTDFFDRDLPKFIVYSENILRVIVFVLPVFMIFSLRTKQQKRGFKLYLVGVLLYFSSWVLVIIAPESAWSKSLIGFTAPAFTTIIWFIGIGLIGSKSYFNIPYLSWIYIGVSLFFVMIHVAHTYLIFDNFG